MKQRIKACPHCGFTDIEYASLRRESGEFLGIGVPEKYYCPRCNYLGSVILELPKSQLVKRNFSKKMWKSKKKKMQKHEVADFAKPIYLVALIMFFISMIIIVSPVQQQEQMETQENILITGEIKNNTGKTITAEPEISVTQEIENALGFGTAGDKFVPVFFVFFVFAFMFTALYGHFHRIKKFA